MNNSANSNPTTGAKRNTPSSSSHDIEVVSVVRSKRRRLSPSGLPSPSSFPPPLLKSPPPASSALSPLVSPPSPAASWPPTPSSSSSTQTHSRENRRLPSHSSSPHEESEPHQHSHYDASRSRSPLSKSGSLSPPQVHVQTQVAQIAAKPSQSKLQAQAAQIKSQTQSVRSSGAPASSSIPRKGRHEPKVKRPPEFDSAFVNSMLCLRARREVEDLSRERIALMAEKKRRAAFNVHSFRIDEMNSKEHSLELVESIPSGMRPSNVAPPEADKRSGPPLYLPGGRGVEPPHEAFLRLGCETAGAKADGHRKVLHGKLGWCKKQRDSVEMIYVDAKGCLISDSLM